MPAFQQLPEGGSESMDLTTARLGTTGAPLGDNDVSKFVALVGDSQYDMTAAGGQIEAIVNSINSGPIQDGFVLGGIQTEGRAKVVFDGLQGTPGTGTIAVGDYVVTGTVVTKGTKLTTYPKVCKATAAANTLLFKWRVVSIISGVGGVGSVGVIEYVG